MGLDMFLKRNLIRMGFGNNNVSVSVTKDGDVVPYVNPEKIESIVEEMGYWRKFNALHNWFVENVQDGIDECQEAHVTIEQLKELHKVLLQVKENPDRASELLPTTEGFFFGGTEYDKYYFGEVSYTIKILERIFREEETCDTYFEYFYRSSW